MDHFGLETFERAVVFDDQFPGSGGRGVPCAKNLGFLHFGFGGREGEVEEIFKLGVWHGMIPFDRGLQILYNIFWKVQSVFEAGEKVALK